MSGRQATAVKPLNSRRWGCDFSTVMTGPAGLLLLTPGEKQACLLTLLFSLFNDNLEEYLIQKLKGNHCVTFEVDYMA